MVESEIILRLSLAVVGGLLLGLDREIRGISAGLRTHGLVSLSSAAITISALLLYDTLTVANSTQNIDPLRVIQGLAQAIGFIAAGAIFFSHGDVHNLTSAANLWLAAALGITAGAGQYVLFLTALALGLILITGVRLLERFLPGKSKPEAVSTTDDDGEGIASGYSNSPNHAVTTNTGHRQAGKVARRKKKS